MLKSTRNLIFIILGYVFVALGVVGIFLPLLPTTPFILLAAFFFSKGSRRCHEWLISQKVLGEIILAWEEDKSITLKTKIIAVSSIVIFFSYSIVYLSMPDYAKIILIITGILISAFIITRKTRK